MNDIRNSLTFRLFALPSFTEGMARIFDFNGFLQVYNVSRTPEDADFEAISNDWRVTGWDIKQAMDEYGQKEKEEQEDKESAKTK